MQSGHTLRHWLHNACVVCLCCTLPLLSRLWHSFSTACASFGNSCTQMLAHISMLADVVKVSARYSSTCTCYAAHAAVDQKVLQGPGNFKLMQYARLVQVCVIVVYQQSSLRTAAVRVATCRGPHQRLLPCHQQRCLLIPWHRTSTPQHSASPPSAARPTSRHGQAKSSYPPPLTLRPPCKPSPAPLP